MAQPMVGKRRKSISLKSAMEDDMKKNKKGKSTVQKVLTLSMLTSF
jgi:hypothetical protein